MNGFTHFIPAVFSVVGLVLLLDKALAYMDPYRIVSYTVFGVGLFLLYLMSTLYHWLPLNEKKVRLLRRLDHMMIFVLIAATYTPLCLISLRGGWGWSLLGVVWTFAFVGIFIKIFWMNASRWVSTSIYLIMGWIAVFAIWPMLNVLNTSELLLLLAGGMFYSVGAVIYALKKPVIVSGFLGFHEIFHVFVALGSFAHFLVIYSI
jgi:hemolysin III